MYTSADILQWTTPPHENQDQDEADSQSSTARRMSSQHLGEVWVKQRRRLENRHTHNDDGDTSVSSGLSMLMHVTPSVSGPTILTSHLDSRHPFASTTQPLSKLASPTTIGTLLHEFRILQYLHSHHILHIVDFALLILDSSTGTETLVQPWIEAATEFSLIEHGVEVTTAIQSLHRVGIVHADLKPDHILLRRLSNNAAESSVSSICLVDFDLAERIATANSSSSSTPSSSSLSPHASSFRGNPHYSSILLHIGCSPSPESDFESLTFICLESWMKLRSHDDNWHLPWIKSSSSSPSDHLVVAADETSMMESLIRWMEVQSWNAPAIHRTGHEKLDAILDVQRKITTNTNTNDAHTRNTEFRHLVQSIRPYLLKLLQISPTASPADPSELMNQMMEILRSQLNQLHATPLPNIPCNPLSSLIDSTLIRRIEQHCQITIESASSSPTSACLIDPVMASSSSSSSSSIPLLLFDSNVVASPMSSSSPSSSSSSYHLYQVSSPLEMCLDSYPETADIDSQLATRLRELDQQCRIAMIEKMRPNSTGQQTTYQPTSSLGYTNGVVFVCHLPSTYTFADIDYFISSLFSSTFLFSIPHIHLAIEVGRFLVACPVTTKATVAVHHHHDQDQKTEPSPDDDMAVDEGEDDAEDAVIASFLQRLSSGTGGGGMKQATANENQARIEEIE